MMAGEHQRWWSGVGFVVEDVAEFVSNASSLETPEHVDLRFWEFQVNLAPVEQLRGPKTPTQAACKVNHPL